MNLHSIFSTSGIEVTSGVDVLETHSVVGLFAKAAVEGLHALASRHTAPAWIRTAERSNVRQRVPNAVYTCRLCDCLTDAYTSRTTGTQTVDVFQHWFGRPLAGKIAWAAFTMFWNTDLVLCDKNRVLSLYAHPDTQELCSGDDYALCYTARTPHEHTLVCIPYYTTHVSYGAPLSLSSPNAVYSLKTVFEHEFRHALDAFRYSRPEYAARNTGDVPLTRPLEVDAYAHQAASDTRSYVEGLIDRYRRARRDKDRYTAVSLESKLSALLVRTDYEFKLVFLKVLNKEFYQRVYGSRLGDKFIDEAASLADVEVNKVITALRNSLKEQFIDEIRRS